MMLTEWLRGGSSCSVFTDTDDVCWLRYRNVEKNHPVPPGTTALDPLEAISSLNLAAESIESLTVVAPPPPPV
jgi:hypothetical protein